mgnify:FL=1
MRISPEFCREQEAVQQARVVNEPLENQKNIARAAAKAWREEAIYLEHRAVAATARDKLDIAISLEFAREVEADAELVHERA